MNDPLPAASTYSVEVLDSRLAAFINEIGIPSRPIILEQVALETRRDTPDFHRIATLVQRDVGLSAGLLKTANSPFFGYRQKARSVREALIMLGLDVAARTIAGVILRHALPCGPQLERFWDASDRIAQLSGWLAQQSGIRSSLTRPEEAFTFGLFRDCGIPILMRHYPEYPQILAAANQESERSFIEVEEERLPTHHAMVGCLLAQNWWLPETTSQAIRHHHDPQACDPDMRQLPEPSRRLVAIAQVAEHLLQDHTGLSQTREWTKLGHACRACLGLSESDIRDLSAEAGALLARMETF